MTFTGRYIRVLVGGRKNRYSKFIQEVIVDPNNNELFLEQVKQLVRKHKLTGLPVFFSYGNHEVLLRSTTIPLHIPRDEWKGYLYMELGESFHLPFQEPIIELVGDRQIDGRQEVTALAVPESDVERIERILKSAKLDPVVIDLPFLSLYRFFGEHFSISGRAHVILLQVELDYVQISLFNGHKPLYVRSLALPKLQDFKMFETRTGYEYIEIEEDSVELDEHFSLIQNEINRLRTFYQFNLQGGAKEIDTLCFSGDHPLLEKLIATYKEFEQMNVYHSNEELLLTKHEVGIPPSFTELIGLSWK